MTKHIITFIGACFLGLLSFAQENVYPAPAYKGLLFLKNATVHVGNGQVLENTTIQINNGKIEKIGQNLPIPMDDVKVFDVSGKHVYPGLILSNSQLGLVEVNSVRATIDHTEIGDINPSIRSIVAYNTDSKVINTLKTNGILMANIVPNGGLISGSSSVVQLDAWNWEDAAVKMENGIHLRLPSLLNRPNPFAAFSGSASTADPVKRGLERIEEIKAFFREAQAYANEPKHSSTNLKYEAVKGLFNKSQKLFVHCDIVKEMLIAVDFAKEFGMDVVIMGGSESWQMADLLKANNVAVVLSQMHSLPTMTDDDVDQPYKTAVALQKAGVLYAINDEDGQTRGRNLAFNAGTSVAYGLTKEQALQAITLNAAKILGIDKQVGSIEVGKDASLVVSEGDILDMRTSIILHAFIQGRKVDLTDKHKQLDERYRKKYGLTK
ncbi:amidohydrolase family protein [Flavihumibacter sp. CACIAM 22H1]|uniref:amidohydrolase family protein n=1 Tax=Flavihumibacter sp. CACIAM 22H1 TaxID=1812911 RepID=UPI0007A8F615|nr:amidohydrolase family protein [Flavihumibacter sp. CACIAM 22H1]KYP15004.1 MAG: amidohydrolase [Flavihumibacter sp. CACIAM 22H1]